MGRCFCGNSFGAEQNPSQENTRGGDIAIHFLMLNIQHFSHGGPICVPERLSTDFNEPAMGHETFTALPSHRHGSANDSAMNVLWVAIKVATALTWNCDGTDIEMPWG